MEASELVERVRDTQDRRLVNTTLTTHGRELVDALDEAIAEEHRRQLGHLSDQQLHALIDLLTIARNPL